MNPAYTNAPLIRHRTYLPPLGRWDERDPLGYLDGKSLYAVVGAAPVSSSDFSGLQAAPPENPPKAPAEPRPRLPDYEWGHPGDVLPEGWYGPIRPSMPSHDSCYRYACNDRSGPGESPAINPGEKGGVDVGLPPWDCELMVRAALADGLRRADPATGRCPEGWIRAFLAIRKYDPVNDKFPFQDYHFWREEVDGTWTCEYRSAVVTRRDPRGLPLSDPAAGGRARYVIPCGYLCVPPDLDLDARSKPPDPPVSPFPPAAK